MTPAEELTAAADKLGALVAEATKGSWRADFVTEIDEDGAFDLAHVLAPNDTPDDGYGGIAVAPSILRPDAAYIAAINPLVGEALAKHMRHEAEWSERYALNGLRFNGHPALLEIARLINGGETDG